MVENELNICSADKVIKFGIDVRFGIIIKKIFALRENPPIVHDDAIK